VIGKYLELIDIEFNKRPLLYVTVAFMLGILAQDQGILNPFAALSFFSASILALLVLKKKALFFLLLSAFFFAVPYAYFRESYPPEHLKNISQMFDYRRVEITGVITEDPEIITSRGAAGIILEAESVKLRATPKINICGRVKVTLKEKIDYGALNYGDRLTVYARFHAPAVPKNPGEFNYRKYLERKKIFLLGSVDQETGDSLEKIGVGHKNPFVAWTIKMKHHLLKVIAATTPGEAAGLVQGVLLGEEEALSAERQQQFRDTGTFHILAVSGFNVALVVAAFFFILRLLKYGKKFSAATSIFFVIIFCFITGCSPSVVRATLICVFALTAVLLERDADIVNLLALSALLMLFIDPNTLFDIGFQLSYISTLGLILLASKIQKYIGFLPTWLGGALAVTLAAQLFVAPVTVYYFNYFSTLTLPANLCLAPFVWFSTVAGFLQAAAGTLFLPLGSAIGFVNAFSVKAMFVVVEFFSGFSFSIYRFSSPGLLFFFVYYISVLLLIYFKDLYQERPAFTVVLLALLSVLVWFKVFTPAAEMEINIMALRSGKAVLVYAGKEAAVLYSEGKVDSYEVGRKILPLLHKKGVNRLSLLIYSAELKDYLTEFRAKELLKLSELDTKAFKIKGENGAVICAGGGGLLAGSFKQQSFFIDREKLVFGEDRRTIYFKETKKNGAFTAVFDGKNWKSGYFKRVEK